MGVIKTALEIALERTETVKSDKSGIDQAAAKKQGKKLANAFLAGESDLAALTEQVQKAPSGTCESLKQGIFDIFVSQIAMPAPGSAGNEDKRIENVGKGLAVVIENKEFPLMFSELLQIFERYRQEAAQYDQAIRQQYAPKLRQKEEEVSRRMGREVRIDPLQDPEFVAFYNQNMNALKAQYEGVVEQAREEARKMFEC
jgi:hypothetical protein